MQNLALNEVAMRQKVAHAVLGTNRRWEAYEQLSGKEHAEQRGCEVDPQRSIDMRKYR
jgi:hypothetical protein